MVPMTAAGLEVELFECERYRMLAGWSSEYLLPTDRQAYRVRGSKTSWRTLPEAEAALLSPGWVWEGASLAAGGPPQWRVDPSGQQADADGWSYATNFNAAYEGSSKGGLQSFVRWRRLTRGAAFSGLPDLETAAAGRPPLAQAWPAHGGCPNVDLEGAAQLGRQLAEALAAASLHGDWCAPAVAKLKWQLLEELLTSQKKSLEAALSAFVASHKTVATRMAEAFRAGDDGAAATRAAEVEAQFPAAEREAFATLAIRRFRRELACPESQEHECRFAAVRCPNGGCGQRCSLRGLESHDRACQFKLVACEKCSEQVPRGQLQAHLSATCPLRQATCAFRAIGCGSELSQRELPGHLQESMQAHTALLLKALLEQQELVHSLTARVAQLEEHAGLQERVQGGAQAAVAGQVAALEAKVAALEKKSERELKKVSDAATSEAKRRADAAAKIAKGDLDPVRKELATLKASVTQLQSRGAAT
mmetsp:Transcript_124491/g.346546  ORF Transcript_124491/g.346546 Transcript_124491/m.346546 type:complete len:478 (-) Transcript_124491:113-1546(-)